MKTSGGDINSLIRKIKPSSNLQKTRNIKHDYNSKKRPVKSNLKKKGATSKRKNVRINTAPKVHFVENWKFLNVDMSREGKRYNRFNRGKRKRNDDLCKIF